MGRPTQDTKTVKHKSHFKLSGFHTLAVAIKRNSYKYTVSRFVCVILSCELNYDMQPWLQHVTDFLSSDDVQGGGVYDLEGNPWAEKVSPFQVEHLEVKLLARGFLDLERQCASARSDAQGAADAEALREVCALAAGMGELNHPLSCR